MESVLAEELEVIRSIYDGDVQLLLLNDEKLQYKFGEDNHHKSFVVEITWPSGYPESADAHVSLDLFYNNHLMAEVKKGICEAIATEMDGWRGSPMTYSILEYIKDNLDELTAKQLEIDKLAITDDKSNQPESKDEVDKDDSVHQRQQLSKAQKRKIWDKTVGGTGGERERGWNWIDIVKHLSQTGSDLVN